MGSGGSSGFVRRGQRSVWVQVELRDVCAAESGRQLEANTSSLTPPCLLTDIPRPHSRDYCTVDIISYDTTATVGLGGRNGVLMLGQRPVQVVLVDACAAESDGPLKAVLSRIAP